MKLCKVCGAEFKPRANFKCCSVECSDVNQKQRMKAWNSVHPERIIEYKQRFIESLR